MTDTERSLIEFSDSDWKFKVLVTRDGGIRVTRTALIPGNAYEKQPQQVSPPRARSSVNDGHTDEVGNWASNALPLPRWLKIVRTWWK